MQTPRRSSTESFDKALVSYQKSVLFLVYPSLIGLISTFLGLFSPSYDFYLSLASERTLAVFFRQNPLGNSNVYGNLVSIGAAVALAAIFICLSLFAAKGRPWALIAAFVLYGADSLYVLFLLNSPAIGSMDLTAWIVQLCVHLLFCFLFSLSLSKYAKLLRLRKGNGPN